MQHLWFESLPVGWWLQKLYFSLQRNPSTHRASDSYIKIHLDCPVRISRSAYPKLNLSCSPLNLFFFCLYFITSINWPVTQARSLKSNLQPFTLTLQTQYVFDQFYLTCRFHFDSFSFNLTLINMPFSDFHWLLSTL